MSPLFTRERNYTLLEISFGAGSVGYLKGKNDVDVTSAAIPRCLHARTKHGMQQLGKTHTQVNKPPLHMHIYKLSNTAKQCSSSDKTSYQEGLRMPGIVRWDIFPLDATLLHHTSHKVVVNIRAYPPDVGACPIGCRGSVCCAKLPKGTVGFGHGSNRSDRRFVVRTWWGLQGLGLAEEIVRMKDVLWFGRKGNAVVMLLVAAVRWGLGDASQPKNGYGNGRGGSGDNVQTGSTGDSDGSRQPNGGSRGESVDNVFLGFGAGGGNDTSPDKADATRDTGSHAARITTAHKAVNAANGKGRRTERHQSHGPDPRTVFG